MEDLNLAQKGDKEAFSRLIEGVKLKMYKTAMAILKNDDDACDAIQETLMSAYKKINTLENIEYFQTWIIRILINKCYDIIRKNQKIININEKLAKGVVPFYEMYSNESELESILNRLEKDLKMVTVLYYYDEIPIKEIAIILNIPEGTVKSRLSRARQSISKIYQLGGENVG